MFMYEDSTEIKEIDADPFPFAKDRLSSVDFVHNVINASVSHIVRQRKLVPLKLMRKRFYGGLKVYSFHSSSVTGQLVNSILDSLLKPLKDGCLKRLALIIYAAGSTVALEVHNFFITYENSSIQMKIHSGNIEFDALFEKNPSNLKGPNSVKLQLLDMDKKIQQICQKLNPLPEKCKFKFCITINSSTDSYRVEKFTDDESPYPYSVNGASTFMYGGVQDKFHGFHGFCESAIFKESGAANMRQSEGSGSLLTAPDERTFKAINETSSSDALGTSNEISQFNVFEKSNL